MNSEISEILLRANAYRCYVGDEVEVTVQLSPPTASQAKNVELTTARAFDLLSESTGVATLVSEDLFSATYRFLPSHAQPDTPLPHKFTVKLLVRHGLKDAQLERNKSDWMHKVGDAVAAAIEIRVDAKVAQICIGIFSSSRYMQYLPGLYAEDDLMGRLLIVAENQLQPCEEHIANLDLYFDPHLTTDEKLRWLAATWLGVRWDERWNERSVEVQRRRLIAKMFDLYRSRGTKRGLQWMLYLALPLDWDEKPDVDVADEEVNELSERFGSMEPGQLKALKKLDKRIRITEYVAEDMELGGKAVLGPGIALGIGNVPYSFDVRVKVPPGEEAKWQDLEPELKRIVASEKPAHTVCRRLEMVEMANV